MRRRSRKGCFHQFEITVISKLTAQVVLAGKNARPGRAQATGKSAACAGEAAGDMH
jgi:hypothetical protein